MVWAQIEPGIGALIQDGFFLVLLPFITNIAAHEKESWKCKLNPYITWLEWFLNITYFVYGDVFNAIQYLIWVDADFFFFRVLVLFLFFILLCEHSISIFVK